MDHPAHFHFRHRRMVEFADTDMAGLMHFSNFLRFAEVTEHAFFRSLGFRVHTNSANLRHGWPRIEVSCKYRQPARFEETLEICLRLEEIRSSSLNYSFWFFGDGADRPLLAHGTCAIIHVEINDATCEIKKTPIPADLRTRLEALLKS
jgi:YbgC/YbaW family acyl-CoA thioester hydrolase